MRQRLALLESIVALVAVSESQAESLHGSFRDVADGSFLKNPLTVSATASLESANSKGAENETSFCDNSMTMSMFMDGFHSSLVPSATFDSNGSSSSSPPSPPSAPLPSCLSYLAPSIELSSRTRFALAMLASFLLALTLEALSALRCRIHCGGSARKKGTGTTRIPGDGGSGSEDSTRNAQAPPMSPRTRHLLLTLIYAVQGLLGYVIMLITMAYSVELLASVIAGLMAGNLVFVTVVSDCYERSIHASEERQRQRQRPPPHLPSWDEGGTLSPLMQPLLQTNHSESLVV